MEYANTKPSLGRSDCATSLGLRMHALGWVVAGATDKGEVWLNNKHEEELKIRPKQYGYYLIVVYVLHIYVIGFFLNVIIRIILYSPRRTIAHHARIRADLTNTPEIHSSNRLGLVHGRILAPRCCKGGHPQCE